eukprot:Gb_41142 [translate_table: standard]
MAVLSCNTSSSAPIASMGQIRRIASTNNRPQNTLAIARVPLFSSVCIRLSGMREIQAVPAWRRHRFESHCITSASDGDSSKSESTPALDGESSIPETTPASDGESSIAESTPASDGDSSIAKSKPAIDGDSSIAESMPNFDDSVAKSNETMIIITPNPGDMSITESKPASERDISIVNPSVVTGYQDVAGFAMTVVTGFYEAINRKDMNALSDLIADGCILNDLSFPKAFEGKQPVLQFMKDLMDAMGKGMVFVIDGMSEGDAFTVGVMWHLEWKGKPFPFTRGCSFFQCEKQGRRLLIRGVQDFIESPVKPGELVLRLLGSITSMFDQFPLLAKSIL